MYRHLSKRQQAEQTRKLEAMRAGRDRARMAREPQGRAPELPNLRRVVTVTDYDTGTPITKELRLYKTRRVDVFRVEAGGMPWKCCGWSVALEGLRKAYPRVPSPRSDFWW
jgi:hypothetical protein